jgi:hypothetical protein
MKGQSSTRKSLELDKREVCMMSPEIECLHLITALYGFLSVRER